jgi:hypothetical protein
MTVPSNTFQTYQAVGNREDLSDMIYMVSPSDTPFQTLAGRTTASSTTHEWQTDALPAADGTNARIEGDDATNNSLVASVRLSNRCQTSNKVIGVTTVQDSAVDKAGRKRELAYQVEKAMRALKTDMETILLSNQTPVTGNATTATALRPLCSWYSTNTSRGASGAAGTTTTAATDGTQRAMSETLLRTVLTSIYTNSNSMATTLMASPSQRANLSTVLTGGATKFYNVDDKTLVATVSVYDSDFGPIKLIPNRFQRSRDVHILNPEYLAVAFLEPVQMQDLAITGRSRRKEIWGTYTLEQRNEAASGIVADLT